MKILIQFPTLARPQKFIDCLEKYIKMSSGKHELFFNINCDGDDETMSVPHIERRILGLLFGTPMCTGEIHYDKNTEKISAINAYVDGQEFDIVVCASDDMIPQVYSWDNEIVSAMTQYFPDLDGCVHFNDGYTDGKLITFSILGRKLYEHFGYIYHPDYKSLYCDDEFTREVIRLNKVQYIDKVIIKHEHYGEKGNSNSGDIDFATRKTLYYSGRDGHVFEERRKRGFPKERITSD